MVSLVRSRADLHIALERDQFQLVFQPIVNLRSQRVVGAEALLRWQHPLEGLLTPDRFLVIAEEAGVTPAVTHWVILKACRTVNQWSTAGRKARNPTSASISPHRRYAIRAWSNTLRMPCERPTRRPLP